MLAVNTVAGRKNLARLNKKNPIQLFDFLPFFLPGNVPSIRVGWLRSDGRPLPRGSYERGGILYLRDLGRRDSGEYVCRGTDARGRVAFEEVGLII